MLIKRMLSKEKLTRKPPISLREFYQKRNKVLIIRNARGIGDILMHRMIFEDLKKAMPEMHLTFACPKNYFDLIRDHPFVDEVVDSAQVNRDNFLISYDTSTCCIKWECANAPNADKHRADIWAEHCGVKLTTHNMHLPFITQDMIQYGLFQVRQAKSMSPKLYDPNSPNILFNPMAFDDLRTLTDSQVLGVVKYLKKKGYFVYSTHNTNIPLLEELAVPVFSGYDIPKWLSLIHAADYVISVDTSTFHYAGGIKKPLTGIFTYADGRCRGKYFDFILVQKHKCGGNWPCGPCYNYTMCSHPEVDQDFNEPKPCLTKLSVESIVEGIEAMFRRWPSRTSLQQKQFLPQINSTNEITKDVYYINKE